MLTDCSTRINSTLAMARLNDYILIMSNCLDNNTNIFYTNEDSNNFNILLRYNFILTNV